MPLLIPIGFFLLLTAAIWYVGYRHYVRPARYYEQIGTAIVSPSGQSGAGFALGDGVLVRTIRQVGQQIPVSPADVAVTRRYLIAAGFRSDEAIQTLYGIKMLSAILFFGLAWVFRDALPFSTLFRWVVVLAGAGAGYALPNFVLEHLVSKRQEELKFALPDALDLMVVCVEAGLGLDQAILKVSEELRATHKEIAEEFGLVTLEMQAGKSRSESLRNLAERTGETELRKLIAILIQTDRFGTSMGESLRTHSDFMRVRRRQEAEERANKVGVKLVFPIFFCILPAMLVVVAGPGILQIMKHLFPMMRQFSQQQGL
jgi:tight adherence protein C